MEKLQVLIIDDDRDIAGFFSTVLSLLGHECETVLSAKEALTRLAGSLPDLILLDLRLGTDIGGDDILYQIRSNPRFDNTRVVVITAYPTIAEMVTNLADLVLIKPVEVEQLKTLIARMEVYEVGPKRSPFRDPITQLFNRDFLTPVWNWPLNVSGDGPISCSLPLLSRFTWMGRMRMNLTLKSGYISCAKYPSDYGATCARWMPLPNSQAGDLEPCTKN
ncbi:MAG TPA: response regulator [Anaerolineaceae bacterium]